MKSSFKPYATLFFFVFGGVLFAQNVIENGYTVTVLDGSSIFYAGIDVESGGLLDVQASGSTTSVRIDGDVTGDENISFGDNTRLNLANGTWNVIWDTPNENNEVLDILTLQTGGFVIVPPGNSVTTKTQLVIFETGTAITLQADASGYAQLLTLGATNTILNTGNGSLLAEQYLTADAVEGWRQLSSPVVTTLADIADDITLSHAGNAPEAKRSVFWYDASPVGTGAVATGGTVNGTSATSNTATTFSSANAKHWTAAANTAEVFGPGNNARAWNIFSGGDAAPLLDLTTPGKIDVEGSVIGTEDYTFECYLTHDYVFEAGQLPLSTDELEITGWNNIPNPYPSNLDVTAILADPDYQANFDYGAIHVWSPANGKNDLQQYRAITDGVETFVNWNTGGGNIGETQNIPPFQSFWVKAERDPVTGNSVAPTALLTLKNSMRTVEDNTNFFKTTPPLIRLTAINGRNENYVDQAILAFDPLSTEGVDRNDAFKFISPNEKVPALYTKVDNAKITINRLPDPDPSYSIPLFLNNQQSDIPFKINMIDENINPIWTIMLEDVKTGAMHNLRLGDYEFMHDGSMQGHRFVVHINKMPGLIDQGTWNNVSVYGNADGINVAFANPDQSTADISITNLSGQVLFSGTVSTGRVFTYPVSEQIAIYAVHVVTGKKVTNEKVVR